MKKLTILLLGVLLLSGCFDYVQQRETQIKVTEAQQEAPQTTESDSEAEIGGTYTKEAETLTQTETEALTEAERETVSVWVTEGVNIRSQQTKLSDRLGGAGFGEQFTAYADTLEDEFVEILYGEGTAYAYGRCLTTDYNVISEMRAEQERRSRRETSTPTEVKAQTERPAESETETETALLQETETETQEQTTAATAIYTAAYFKQAGVLNWGGSKWTWYTQRILPGEGLWIPGRHLDENGYVCDENGYIVCAADLSYIPRYTVIETPLGKLGKIYDTGCAYGVIDVYTDW